MSWCFLFLALAARAVVLYIEILKHALSHNYMLMALWVGRPNDDSHWLGDSCVYYTTNERFKSLMILRVGNYAVIRTIY